MDSGYGYGDPQSFGRVIPLGNVHWSNFDNVQYYQPSESEGEDQGNQAPDSWEDGGQQPQEEQWAPNLSKKDLKKLKKKQQKAEAEAEAAAAAAAQDDAPVDKDGAEEPAADITPAVEEELPEAITSKKKKKKGKKGAAAPPPPEPMEEKAEESAAEDGPALTSKAKKKAKKKEKEKEKKEKAKKVKGGDTAAAAAAAGVVAGGAAAVAVDEATQETPAEPAEPPVEESKPDDAAAPEAPADPPAAEEKAEEPIETAIEESKPDDTDATAAPETPADPPAAEEEVEESSEPQVEEPKPDDTAPASEAPVDPPAVEDKADELAEPATEVSKPDDTDVAVAPEALTEAPPTEEKAEELSEPQVEESKPDEPASTTEAPVGSLAAGDKEDEPAETPVGGSNSDDTPATEAQPEPSATDDKVDALVEETKDAEAPAEGGTKDEPSPEAPEAPESREVTEVAEAPEDDVKPDGVAEADSTKDDSATAADENIAVTNTAADAKVDEPPPGPEPAVAAESTPPTDEFSAAAEKQEKEGVPKAEADDAPVEAAGENAKDEVEPEVLKDEPEAAKDEPETAQVDNSMELADDPKDDVAVKPEDVVEAPKEEGAGPVETHGGDEKDTSESAEVVEGSKTEAQPEDVSNTIEVDVPKDQATPADTTPVDGSTQELESTPEPVSAETESAADDDKKEESGPAVDEVKESTGDAVALQPQVDADEQESDKPESVVETAVEAEEQVESTEAKEGKAATTPEQTDEAVVQELEPVPPSTTVDSEDILHDADAPKPEDAPSVLEDVKPDEDLKQIDGAGNSSAETAPADPSVADRIEEQTPAAGSTDGKTEADSKVEALTEEPPDTTERIPRYLETSEPADAVIDVKGADDAAASDAVPIDVDEAGKTSEDEPATEPPAADTLDVAPPDGDKTAEASVIATVEEAAASEPVVIVDVNEDAEKLVVDDKVATISTDVAKGSDAKSEDDMSTAGDKTADIVDDAPKTDAESNSDSKDVAVAGDTPAINEPAVEEAKVETSEPLTNENAGPILSEEKAPGAASDASPSVDAPETSKEPVADSAEGEKNSEPGTEPETPVQAVADASESAKEAEDSEPEEAAADEVKSPESKPPEAELEVTEVTPDAWDDDDGTPEKIGESVTAADDEAAPETEATEVKAIDVSAEGPVSKPVKTEDVSPKDDEKPADEAAPAVEASNDKLPVEEQPASEEATEDSDSKEEGKPASADVEEKPDAELIADVEADKEDAGVTTEEPSATDDTKDIALESTPESAPDTAVATVETADDKADPETPPAGDATPVVDDSADAGKAGADKPENDEGPEEDANDTPKDGSAPAAEAEVKEDFRDEKTQPDAPTNKPEADKDDIKLDVAKDEPVAEEPVATKAEAGALDDKAEISEAPADEAPVTQQADKAEPSDAPQDERKDLGADAPTTATENSDNVPEEIAAQPEPAATEEDKPVESSAEAVEPASDDRSIVENDKPTEADDKKDAEHAAAEEPEAKVERPEATIEQTEAEVDVLKIDNAPAAGSDADKTADSDADAAKEEAVVVATETDKPGETAEADVDADKAEPESTPDVKATESAEKEPPSPATEKTATADDKEPQPSESEAEVEEAAGAKAEESAEPSTAVLVEDEKAITSEAEEPVDASEEKVADSKAASAVEDPKPEAVEVEKPVEPEAEAPVAAVAGAEDKTEESEEKGTEAAAEPAPEEAKAEVDESENDVQPGAEATLEAPAADESAQAEEAPEPEAEKAPEPEAEKAPEPEAEKAPEPEVEETAEPKVGKSAEPVAEPEPASLEEVKAPEPAVEKVAEAVEAKEEEEDKDAVPPIPVVEKPADKAKKGEGEVNMAFMDTSDRGVLALEQEEAEPLSEIPLSDNEANGTTSGTTEPSTAVLRIKKDAPATATLGEETTTKAMTNNTQECVTTGSNKTRTVTPVTIQDMMTEDKPASGSHSELLASHDNALPDVRSTIGEPIDKLTGLLSPENGVAELAASSHWQPDANSQTTETRKTTGIEETSNLHPRSSEPVTQPPASAVDFETAASYDDEEVPAVPTIEQSLKEPVIPSRSPYEAIQTEINDDALENRKFSDTEHLRVAPGQVNGGKDKDLVHDDPYPGTAIDVVASPIVEPTSESGDRLQKTQKLEGNIQLGQGHGDEKIKVSDTCAVIDGAGMHNGKTPTDSVAAEPVLEAVGKPVVNSCKEDAAAEDPVAKKTADVVELALQPSNDDPSARSGTKIDIGDTDQDRASSDKSRTTTAEPARSSRLRAVHTQELPKAMPHQLSTPAAVKDISELRGDSLEDANVDRGKKLQIKRRPTLTHSGTQTDEEYFNQRNTLVSGSNDPRAATPGVIVPDSNMVNIQRARTLRRKRKMSMREAEDAIAAAVVIYATAEALSPPVSPLLSGTLLPDPDLPGLDHQCYLGGKGKMPAVYASEDGFGTGDESLQKSEADLYTDDRARSSTSSRGDGDRERTRRRRHSHNSGKSRDEAEAPPREARRRPSHASHGSTHASHGSSPASHPPLARPERRRTMDSSDSAGATKTPPRTPRRRDSGFSAESSGSSGRRHRSERAPEEQAARDKRRAERAAQREHQERRDSPRSRDAQRREYEEGEHRHQRSSRRQSHSSHQGRPDLFRDAPSVEDDLPEKKFFEMKNAEGVLRSGSNTPTREEAEPGTRTPPQAEAPKTTGTARTKTSSFSRRSTDAGRNRSSRSREDAQAGSSKSQRAQPAEDAARRARHKERRRAREEEEKKPSGIKGMFKKLFT